jgi:predicted phage-related endonuclease
MPTSIKAFTVGSSTAGKASLMQRKENLVNKQFFLGFASALVLLVGISAWAHYMDLWRDKYHAVKSVCNVGQIVDDGMFGYPHCLVEIKP